MKVAVTGAAGHLGAAIVRGLIAQGRAVRVLVRNDRRAVEGLDVEEVAGDVTELDSLMRLFQGVETVYHAAAAISLVGSENGLVESINIGGTRNVIQACRKSGVKNLIYFSSIHAFRDCPNGVIDETCELATGDGEFPYDRSKAVSQKEVIEAADAELRTIVINPTGIIGPYDYKISRMGRTLIDIYCNRIPLLIDGGYNWVDSRDVASCAFAAEERGRSGHCYLACGRWVHICEVASIISELYGKKTARMAAPLWLCTLPSYLSLAAAKVSKTSPRFTPYTIRTLKTHQRVCHEKATRELGYQPRPIRETIRDTIDWFKAQGIIS